jgi:hypothetical protein
MRQQIQPAAHILNPEIEPQTPMTDRNAEPPLFADAGAYDLLMLASVVSMQIARTRETAKRIAAPENRARTDVWATVHEVEIAAESSAPALKRSRKKKAP